MSFQGLAHASVGLAGRRKRTGTRARNARLANNTRATGGGGLCSLGIFLLFRRLTGGRPVVVVVQDARRECYLI